MYVYDFSYIHWHFITLYFHEYDDINCHICTYYFIFFARIKSIDFYCQLIYAYYTEQFVYALGFLTSISPRRLSPPVILLTQGSALYESLT